MPFRGQENKSSGGTGKGTVKGAPPVAPTIANPPAGQNMPHAPQMDMVKGSPAPVKSVSADDFTTSQPSEGVNVKSGQGPI